MSYWKAPLRQAVTVTLAALAIGCGPQGGATAGSAAADAASKVYVAPGQKDEFYAFMSGGFSGNVAVYGLPSGRLFAQIAVFSQYPEKGYGYSEQTKAMLNTSYGFVPWDDAHHPELSMTDGVPDGRWLFINGNNTPRVARVDLARFETDEIIEIPNSGGGHASPFITMNTEYAVSATRFSVPIPQEDVAISQYAEKFKGTLTFVKVSPEGKLSVAFQILEPGLN
jgi:nitrous-oxide reductase